MLSVHVADVTYLSLGWDEVEDYVSELAERVYSVYQPNTLLAVMRGGAIVGVMLADRLGVRRVCTVNLRFYEKPEVRGVLDIYQKPPMECISNNVVLVIDDIVDTGQSLSAVMHLRALRRAKEVRSSALLVKEHSTYMPDFYIRKVEGWVFYPWEVREACEEIYSKICSINEAKKILINGLGFSQKAVEQVLGRLKVK
ncbi:MAG: phosphoribosyltransferase family protein [Nitrososphaerales archaeon]